MILSRYSPGKELQRKEYNRVFLADDQVTGETVVIKETNPRKCHRSVGALRKLLALSFPLHHPVLVTPVDLGICRETGFVYQVLPHIVHVPLHDFDFKVLDLIHLATQAAQGFAFLWRLELGYCDLDPSHFLWLNQPEPNNIQLKLISYDFLSKDINTQLQQLSRMILALAEKNSLLSKKTNENDLETISILLDILQTAAKHEQRNAGNAALQLVMDLIGAFDDHLTEKRPTRRIYFTEPPLLTRPEVQKKLDQWFEDKSPGSVMMVKGLEGIDRTRLIKRWLAGKKLQGYPIVELDQYSIQPFLMLLTDKGSFFILDELFAHSSLLLVVYPTDTNNLIDVNWDILLSALRQRSWSMIIAMDDAFSSNPKIDSVKELPVVSQTWIGLLTFPEFNQSVEILLGSNDLSRNHLIQLFNQSSGNPGLMIQIINYWISEDILVQKNDRWYIRFADPNQQLPRPADVQNQLLQRLDHLQPEFKKILIYLALIRHPLTETQLKQISDSKDVSDTLEFLVQRDILRRIYQAGTPECYWFSHSVFQTMLTSAITPDDARIIHQKIAELMEKYRWESEHIARHYLLGNQLQKGIKWGLEIVRNYRVSGEFQKAEEWADLLRTNLADLPDTLQGQVYSVHAEISLLRHRHQDVLKSGEMGLKLLPVGQAFSEERSFLYQYMGQVFSREGKYQQAAEVIEKGLAELSGDDSETAVTLRVLKGALHRKSGDNIQAQKEIEEAWNAYENITDEISRKSAYATILNLVGSLCYEKGEIRQARRISDESIALSDENDFIYYKILLRNKRALLEINSGNVAIAERYLSETYRLCQSANVRSELAVAYQISSDIAYIKGEYTDAELLLDKAESIREQLHRAENTLVPMHRFSRLFRRVGKFQKARDLLSKYLPVSDGKKLTPSIAQLMTSAGYLNMEQARYTEALRFFLKAQRCYSSLGHYPGESNVHYGLALTYWRLNHLPRMRRHLNIAKTLAIKYEKKLLLAWCVHLEARMERLDRNRTAFNNCISKALELFTICSSKPGQLAIEELKLRDMIDSDLSDETWNIAVKLWERVRVIGSWRQTMDVALTVTRLGARRGKSYQVETLLDSIVGIAQEKNTLDDHVRLLRIRALFQEAQGLETQALESYNFALAQINTIKKSIQSPILRRSFLSRYDVQHIRNRILHLEKGKQRDQWFVEKLPDLRFVDESRSSQSPEYKSEYNRLVKQAIARFRYYVNKNELVNDLMEISLKLSSADRCVVYLQESGQELFEVATEYRLGFAPKLDPKLVRTSMLFQKSISGKHSIFSKDVANDLHVRDHLLKRHIGTRSVLIVPLRAARKVVGLIYLDTRLGSEDKMNTNSGLIQDLADEAALSLEISTLYSDLDDSFMSMVRALGTTVDAKDEYTHGHSARVATYAMVIGRELGLKANDMRDLEIAAYLHDIGKIGISGVILKSASSLSKQDQDAIRMHPVIGTRILSPVRKLTNVAQIIRQHHERYDGTGYPDQLKGENILLNARIIAVADALDAMTTHRPYHKSMGLDDAVEIISENSGTQFDPLVAGAVKDLHYRGKLSRS